MYLLLLTLLTLAICVIYSQLSLKEGGTIRFQRRTDALVEGYSGSAYRGLPPCASSRKARRTMVGDRFPFLGRPRGRRVLLHYWVWPDGFISPQGSSLLARLHSPPPFQAIAALPDGNVWMASAVKVERWKRHSRRVRWTCAWLYSPTQLVVRLCHPAFLSLLLLCGTNYYKATIYHCSPVDSFHIIYNSAELIRFWRLVVREFIRPQPGIYLCLLRESGEKMAFWKTLETFACAFRSDRSDVFPTICAIFNLLGVSESPVVHQKTLFALQLCPPTVCGAVYSYPRNVEQPCATSPWYYLLRNLPRTWMLLGYRYATPKLLGTILCQNLCYLNLHRMVAP